jgi:tRNA wybutosine-synthesizing protein 4
MNDSPRLDFNAKNFKYVTEPFGKVVSKMERGARMYLRSLSRSKPSDIPANIKDDFPALAPDFTLPSELHLARQSLFSSILRLSGMANMWLHYDVSLTGQHRKRSYRSYRIDQLI